VWGLTKGSRYKKRPKAIITCNSFSLRRPDPTLPGSELKSRTHMVKRLWIYLPMVPGFSPNSRMVNTKSPSATLESQRRGTSMSGKTFKELYLTGKAKCKCRRYFAQFAARSKKNIHSRRVGSGLPIASRVDALNRSGREREVVNVIRSRLKSTSMAH
jgi:hypothetical protein